MVGEIDAGDVVAHVVERRAADARFAAVSLTLADLIGQPHGAVQEALRRERYVAKPVVKTVQMLDKRFGIAIDIGKTGAKQLGLDGMEAAVGIRPGIDLGVEFWNKAHREHFRTLPSGARGNPGLLRALQIPGSGALTQFKRT